MHNQPLTNAMSTQDLMTSLDTSNSDDEGKMSGHDCLVTLLQVVSAVGFCGLINFVAM